MKKFISLVIATVMAMTALSLNAFALIEDEGYLYADTLSLSQTVTTDSLTYAEDEHWYTFSIATANAPYSISLYNAPSVGAYSYELRYQQTANTRPIIIENEPYIKTSNGRVNMMGVLRETGTYYIRVYSLTGAYSSSPYTLSLDINYLLHSVALSTVSADRDYDWAVCAAMAGNKIFNREFGVDTTRTYKNATKFIKTGGNAEYTNSPQFITKPDTDVTATAANYIFSGDYMDKPIFEVNNSEFELVDFLEEVWKLNKQYDSNPVIVKLVDTDDYNVLGMCRYFVLDGVNISAGTIHLIDPAGGSKTFNLQSLKAGGLMEYLNLRYTGNNIVCTR